MNKIPTLFVREFPNKHILTTEEVTPGFEWVLNGEGVATIKYDGVCCGIVDGVWCKRYDAKRGKIPPAVAIPCCEPDPITGHWPHWIPINEKKPEDKWYFEAIKNSPDVIQYGIERGENGHKVITFEAAGRHFNGNPYGRTGDYLEPHGCSVVTVERTYDGIRKFLQENEIEGLVFWKDGQPQCKIKRKDFGFKWPPPKVDDTTKTEALESVLRRNLK